MIGGDTSAVEFGNGSIVFVSMTIVSEYLAAVGTFPRCHHQDLFHQRARTIIRNEVDWSYRQFFYKLLSPGPGGLFQKFAIMVSGRVVSRSRFERASELPPVDWASLAVMIA